MASDAHLLDIRDKGGLALLRDAPIGKLIQFYEIGKLRVCQASVDLSSNTDDPCKECFFFLHPVPMPGIRQCAVWKYCTSPHRSDHKSVVFKLEL